VNHRISWLWIGLSGLLALAAMAALAHYLVPWGPWAFSDSVAYVDAARGVLSGRGLTVRQDPEQSLPLAHYPPLYPLTLAAVMGCCHVDWLTAARWIDVIAYGVFVFLLAELSRRALSRTPWVGVLVAALIATSPVVVRNYSGIMTEPLFFTLSLMALVTLWAYARRPRDGLLLAAGSAAAAAVLTRYAGLFLAPALALAPWLAANQRRLRASGLALAPFLLAYGVWNAIMHARGNTLHFAWPSWAEVLTKTQGLIRALPEVFWLGWLEMPRLYKAIPGMAWVAVGLTAGAWLAALLARRKLPAPSARAALDAVLLAWGLALTYLLFFYAAHLFRRPEPDFNPRVAAPLFWLGLYGWSLTPFVLYHLLGLQARRVGHLSLLIPPVALLLGVIAYQAPVTKAMLYTLHGYGLGYTAKPWHQPKAWARLRAWPEDIPLMADEAEAMLLWADRPAYLLPEIQGRRDIIPLGEGEGYHQAYREGRLAVVHFLPSWPRWVKIYQHNADEAVDLLFHRREPCVRTELFELFYNGPRAAELCDTGQRSGP